MRTVRRLLYRDIVGSVAFVTLAFLSLFFFIDFVDELNDTGKRGRTLGTAVLSSLLEVPGHLYELLPISVLIGTIYALARMAQSSEFTILRTGGLGPGRALGLLAGLGVAFAALTFVIGDYVAPPAEREGVLVKARARGGLAIGRTGAWLKERRSEDGVERNFSINIGAAGDAGSLRDVRIFEADAAGRLVARIEARAGRVGGDGTWTLSKVTVARWPVPSHAGSGAAPPAAPAASGPGTGNGAPMVQLQSLPELRWPSTLSPEVVAGAVLPLKTMSTYELWRYGGHLSAQEQDSQRYEIQFWKKALYPFACLVMVALALPFAYLHARAGGVSLKVFGGIMLGISFVLLNNVASHLGMLRDWTPWVAAAMPGLVYLVMSLAAFAWLVRYR
jgi:lipopolysaccharide export system permease protein